ncbi:MAG: hypothetical protein IPH18_00025 [Chitinophagaceae bacterium]|nr:hypothetical protein [Chitinophagaceae bacterium]
MAKIGSGTKPNNGDARKHGGTVHDDAINNRVGQLKRDESSGEVRNVRKNQAQVDVNAKKVGDNRPDVQYDKWNSKTRKWEHHNVEYDNNAKNSKAHGAKINENDKNSVTELNVIK